MIQREVSKEKVSSMEHKIEGAAARRVELNAITKRCTVPHHTLLSSHLSTADCLQKRRPHPE